MEYLDDILANISLSTVLVTLVTLYFVYTKIRRPRLRKLTPQDAILITGASTGIGRYTALYLVNVVGLKVYAGVRKMEDGEALLANAKKKELLVPILLDVTNVDHITAAVQKISGDVGARGLYSLWCNAGITRLGPLTPIEYARLDDYRTMFEVNFYGVVEITKAFLPLLRAAKGRIIYTSSLAGVISLPYRQPYHCTKFALESLADSLRREVHSFGVSVSVLQPGSVISDAFQKAIAFGIKDWQHYPKCSLVSIHSRNEAIAKTKSPMVVAKAVEHALTSTNPKIRYVMGGSSTMVSLLAMLPTSWIDFIVKRTESGIPEGIKPTEFPGNESRKDLDFTFE